jgi:hypothetical protein
MKLATYSAVIIILLLVIAIQTVVGQDAIVAGVKSGDKFTYSVTGSYSTDAPIGDVPEEIINAEASTSFQVTIVNATGPEIWYDWVWHFNNGSALNNSSMVNIETVENNGPFWPIVAANLSAGDRIHPHYGPDLSYFNETGMWTYTNYTRETNHLTLQFLEQNNVTGTQRATLSDAFFDKQTGILVQLTEETEYQSPSFTTSITWQLIGQNAWTFSSAGSYPLATFSTLLIIIVIVIVVAIVVIIVGWFAFNRRKNARKKQLLRKK